MILRELLLWMGLEVDEAAFAKGELAAKVLEKAFDKVVEVAQETVHKFVELVEKTAESGVEIMEMSKATGIATDTIQDFMTAAAFTGVAVDQLKIGIFSLSRNMYAAAQGSEEAQKGFAKLGIKVKNADGTMRGADEVMLDVADKFKEMPDGVNKAALAMQLFGKAGKDMIEMLSEGREGIAELANETPNLTKEQLQASKEIVKTQKQIALTMENLWQRAIGPLLPAINELLKRYLAWKRAGAELMRQRIEKYLGYVIALIGKLATVAGWVYEAFDATVGVIKMFLGVIWKAAQGFKFLYDQLQIVRIMLGYAGLLGAIWAFAWASESASVKVMLAWLKAAAPFILIAAAVAGLILIMDDLNAYAEGRDSLFGRVVDGIDKWLRIKPEDSPFMKGIKAFLQMLRDAVEVLVELDDVFGDGSKKRAMLDRQAGLNKGQQQQQTDRMQLETARTQARAGVPLTDASKAVLKRAGVPEKSFVAQYRGTGTPEARVDAGAGMSGAGGAGSGVLMNAPTQIIINPPVGTSPDDMLKAANKAAAGGWEAELEASMAGTSY